VLKSWLSPLLGRKPAPQAKITIVSGLPRSGTSLMMRMLEAGGLPVLTDQQRAADEDNPQGYYELELVKQLSRGNHGWLHEAQGKGVKVISALLPHLPAEHQYNVIWMERTLSEILASQRKMLRNRGEPLDTDDEEELALTFTRHLREVRHWLELQPNITSLTVNYNQLLAKPRPTVQTIKHFLAHPLDEARMVATVDPVLYRNRGG
jgi:hypothetical protein